MRGAKPLTHWRRYLAQRRPEGPKDRASVPKDARDLYVSNGLTKRKIWFTMTVIFLRTINQLPPVGGRRVILAKPFSTHLR
jgi:hypothetical protein